MMSFICVLLIVMVALCAGEVVQLDSKNFEHLTQASTGATTGDWLVKFYAPWCGHCRKMEPAYERVSEMLAGEVNVGRVDVPANRDIGTRFDVKGFPSIKLLSKGKVYDYSGRRTAEDIAEFARGGYQIQQPADVPAPMGTFGEIITVFKHAYKQAALDLKGGNFFTVDVFLSFLPILFFLFVALILMIPAPTYTPPTASRKAAARDDSSAGGAKRSADAAAPTSETDAPAPSSKKAD
jgi:thioredoxin domain-containing protein 5